MKAKELMIDDWVEFNGSPYQIEEISKSGWVHLIYNGVRASVTTDYLLDVLQPIPLTPEILDKNGIEWNGKYGFFKEDVDHYLDLFKGYIDIWWSIKAVDYQIIPIKYVHQLQLIIKLCGINKEIIL